MTHSGPFSWPYNANFRKHMIFMYGGVDKTDNLGQCVEGGRCDYVDDLGLIAFFARFQPTNQELSGWDR